MHLTDQQLRRIADALLDALLDEGTATLKRERGMVLTRIEEIFRQNLADEKALEQDAQTLLESHLENAPPDMDRHKLLTMIKKKLAEERDFPL